MKIALPAGRATEISGRALARSGRACPAAGRALRTLGRAVAILGRACPARRQTYRGIGWCPNSVLIGEVGSRGRYHPRSFGA